MYRTGQFAHRTAVSVRTLRFYDKVGLLTPSRRTPAGYRLYTDGDLARLQQILALKFLGFSLDEIKALLRGAPGDLREVLCQQRAMLRERRAQLDTVMRAVEEAERALRTDACDWNAIVQVIRAMQMEQNNDWVKKYLTDEQRQTMTDLSEQSYSPSAQAKLASRSPAWTEADQQRVSARYDALYAGVKALVAAGKEPDSPEAQALARDAWALLDEFTQGDPEIFAGLKNWWHNHDQLPKAQRPFQSPLSADESAFLEEAKRICRPEAYS
ncbi:MAG: MerR family transcriptional regulator [Thermomicrobiales bacterium]